MKRARESDEAGGVAVWMTPPPARGLSHQHHWSAPAHGGEASISPWKQQHGHATFKRCRDRSVPMDAMSRMMSAAVTSARMKKHVVAMLFGQAAPSEAPKQAVCCAVCTQNGAARREPAAAATAQCSHCERAVGECCRRECEACSGVFCSLCSTLNCDEQFDRVFCLSCSYELAHS